MSVFYSNKNFDSQKFSGVDLQNENFKGSRMQEQILGADLSNANFPYLRVSDFSLNMTGINLSGSDLWGALFKDAILQMLKSKMQVSIIHPAQKMSSKCRFD